MFKSEVAYFNDDSKTEQRKVKSSRLGKFQFSQRQYCLLSPQQNLQRVPALASLSEYIHTSSRGIDSINQTATTYHSVKHWLSHRTRDNRFQSLTLLSTSMPFHSLSLMVTHSLWCSPPVCHWFYPFSPFWEESWLRFHYQDIS